MIKKKYSISIIIVILFIIPFFAQESNIFLNRDYWKSNPSIANINQKIAEGHDIAELNRFAFDAVSWALIEKVDNETVKYLLSKEGNGVNKLTHDGRTYIFWAAYKNNLEMMQYLVDRGAKTDIIDSHGYSLLNFVAVTGQTNTKLYDFIFDHGPDAFKELNHDGANALLLVAPFLEDFWLINYFTSKGIDLKSTDNNGNGIFYYAAKGGNIKFLDLLIEKGLPHKNLNTKGGNAMVSASQGTRGKKNTLETYKYLQSKGIAVNIVGDNGKSPLHNVAYDSEDLELFKFFIDNGVDVNHQDDDGNSPFMNATGQNTLEVITYLLQYVKDVNAINKNGRAALTMAVSRNDVEVVNFLLEKGADISIIDEEGNSLVYDLLNSYRSNDTEAFDAKLKLLTNAGLDMSRTQGHGKTLYHLAVEKNNLDLLKRVYDEFKIDDINAKNNDGLTPLHVAAMKAKNQEILKFLISIGADKTAKTDFEESVYDLASENELLQKNNVNINFLE
ncbi:ankyrin repeat domain-containing protein [Winogradskyella sp.]|uniref:ankyrin repeat domain-containing protein n=1 Tax=Winogradskyella sp. TaxID=1883156 RepID=UPI00260F7AD5|nr:ankyrin repeat domain-containing protein [Winogradskyella sp.]